MSSLEEGDPKLRGTRAPSRMQGQAARSTEESTHEAKKPFQQVIDVSTGDSHRAGMKPVSFVRQVLAACVYPELLDENNLPLDARQRAHKLLGACTGGSVGSYSATAYGIPYVCKSVAEFIMKRDGGVRSNPEDIIFAPGSTKTLLMVLHLMASGEGEHCTAVLTPMPCPHTLPMLLDMAGLILVPYQLMEDRGGAVDLEELHRALETTRGRCSPRAIYISNPGNPTGHVQDRKSIEDVIRFAATEGLVLLADEVYQDSVYGQGKEFLSYKRVLFEMGKEYSETVELISFHSLSSGCMGECGLRGGYMEAVNLDQAVLKYLRGLQASSSPPVFPQLALEVMVNPPKPEDPSYKTYSQNAHRACEFLNDLPGMKCQPAWGGVFIFPRMHLPHQMVEEAKVLGVKADVLYCQMLLEEEGVRLGAGCENGQEDPNYHIRLCVLAPPDTLEEMLARLQAFHLRLLERFP
ncbi:alanine aminotransferase 2-like isoform X2 [Eleginops maclovinus]|uniref:alanine aminotransferase 2-like isoform X2 n=1 Tax=Eleginops maclovinus TaxID=56733 RepID=UPI0030802089